jgi:hypothetical protein
LSRCGEAYKLELERFSLAACVLMMRTDVKSLIAALPQEEAERARARLDRLEQTCACGLAVAGAFAVGFLCLL